MPTNYKVALDAVKDLPNAMKKDISVFKHGTFELEIYKPLVIDEQQPHTRDEGYIIISGTGTYYIDEERTNFKPGDFLFAPAGAIHRFENFSEDFLTWVIFYGPVGGEKV